MNFVVDIVVTLKPSVLDPQGTTVKEAFHSMGYSKVDDVRMGKYMEVTISAGSKEEAQGKADEMCRKVLVNPVIETYSFDIKEQEKQEVN
ncbi:phosphoribosylformylglycinamidine synthase subunit PurS [bacterium]|nr:phosphoribosylformylglycinamidine synthase subunit PurS [bacterium]